jgi:translation elongation factor EF-Tu-like GTPase
MSNKEIGRSKPFVKVGTIGSIGQGKTTVTDALAKVAAEKGWTSRWSRSTSG